MGGYAIAYNEWIFDSSIKNELPLLLYISSLTAENGYCFAGNSHLAKKFNTTDVSISRKIKKLVEKQHIKVEYKKRGAEVVDRRIRLTRMLTDDYQECYSTVNKNVKENITSTNITSTNKKTSKKSNPLKEIIDIYRQSVSNLNGKIKEQRSFNLLTKLTPQELEELKEGLKAYGVEAKSTDAKYIKPLDKIIENKEYKDFKATGDKQVEGWTV